MDDSESELVRDSTGKVIMIGDMVIFRGKPYVVDGFGKFLLIGATEIKLQGDIHTTETPHEFNVDLIKQSGHKRIT